jgi:3-mercaptopyruvate sulfurtransferase SseA
MERGYRKVYALKGGWDAWEDAGYPVQEKPVGAPIKN